MKPFDLEKALAGEPILLLNNDPPLKAYINKSSLRDDAFIIEFENEDRTVVRRSKKWLKKYGKNLVMWQEPRPRVQLDLPCPLERPIKAYYYIEGQSIFECSYCEILSDYIFNKFELGLCFASREDAQEWLDAMRNARR